MPQLDTYSQGSVTLYANATLVVGSGTAWRDGEDIVRQVNAGDMFVFGAFVALIVSVDSPTQLTLAQAYPGATASGLPYDIFRYQQLATPAAIAFMQRERARGGPSAPFVRMDVDTGNVRMSLRDGGDGKGGLYVGVAGSVDGAQTRALAFDASGNGEFGGEGGLILPAGTTAQRIASEGRTRRNTTTNRAETFLGGAWRTLAHANGDTIASDIAAPSTVSAGSAVTAGGASVGRALLRPGDATRPGYVEFRSADDTRRAYLGWKDGGGNNIVLQPENGWGVRFNGAIAFENRPTFGGAIAWDAGNLGVTTPEAFVPSAGTGSDDTAALQAAISSGRHVLLNPTKDYITTSPLYQDGKVGQHIIGGVIKPFGAFNAIIARGAFSCVYDLAMRCAGMSGGYAIEFRQNSERCTVKKLHILDNGYNLAYVEQCNAITFDWLYGINLRGDRGVRWYGDNSKRSDILTINFAGIAAVAGNQSLVGIDWDGNCNSMYGHNIHTVNCLYGLLVRNASGGSPPQIGRFNAFATDFSFANGINITSGDDLDFMQPYINGAGYLQSGLGHHGMLVDGLSSNGTVRVFGGKSIGNRGHGFACNPANSLFVHGSKVGANLESNGFQLHPSSLLLT